MQLSTRSRRTVVAAAAAGALLAPLALAAQAAVVTTGTRSGSLVQVGPISDHGFPTWYRDSNGLRLEACWDFGDPLCAPLADEVPNPEEPVSFPDNFPVEHFYSMAAASVGAGVAGTVDVVMNLEAAWAVEEVRDGDQIVFGRVRIRARDAADGTYRIVHPYGTDEFTAAGGEGIDMTDDIGIAPGAFGGALQSRIGPFLVWDTFGAATGAPPAGYIGDPGVEHRIKGSPYGQDYVEVQRLDPASGSFQPIGRTDLFAVQGRLAVNDGVDVQQATYRKVNGTTVVEVFATSEAGESIKMVAPGLGYRSITLEEDAYEVATSATSSHLEGRYYGRFGLKSGVEVTGGADATKIVIQNAGDVPVTSKTIALSDVVTVSRATYDGATLVVEAASSDPAAGLTVSGFGPVTAGTGSFTGVDAPPHVITVTSSEGGSATVPLTTNGGYTAPDAPVAVVTATPTRPIAGRALTLDATESLDATRWEFEQVPPEGHTTVPASRRLTLVPGATDSIRTVTPTLAGRYAFEVTAIGDGGRSPAQRIEVQVLADTAVVAARAGALQEAQRGTKVTLDGSLSVGAAKYRWEQIPNGSATSIPADQKVVLSDPTAAKPTFTMPLNKLPAVPGPNGTYTSVAPTPLRFQLTVTGVNGTVSDPHQTVVRPQPEKVLVAEARYRTRGEWRVSGTSSLPAGQQVRIVLHTRFAGATDAVAVTGARGPVIGTATVDAAGAWSYVGTGPNPQTSTPLGTRVTVVSAQGGLGWGGVTVTG